ncbi:MAG: hypothetical protein C4583_04310 [Anaerolineaceae bacterium]|nr:MAG: hypothetical protein C4583_04310 [Anaerolineaceae bacterium]
MPVAKPKFDLPEEFRQLALGLELPEVELDEMSVEEARLKSEAGRSALFALKGMPNQPVWFERFEQLINGGWPWRQAAFIAWASMPKNGRIPKSQEELAKRVLNLTSDRAISTWRKKNPAIDAMVAVLQSAELWDHRADAFQQLVEGVKRAGTDYKFAKHLEMFLRMTGDDVPTSQLVALIKRKGSSGPREIDDDTLDELAAGVTEINQGLAGEEEDDVSSG